MYGFRTNEIHKRNMFRISNVRILDKWMMAVVVDSFPNHQVPENLPEAMSFPGLWQGFHKLEDVENFPQVQLSPPG